MNIEYTIIYNNIDLSGSSKNIYIKSFLKYGMDLFIKKSKMNKLTYVPYSEDDVDYVNTDMHSTYPPPNYKDLQRYQQLTHAPVEKINVGNFFRQSIRTIDSSGIVDVELKYKMIMDTAKLPDYAIYSDPLLYKNLKKIKNKVLKSLHIIRNICLYCNPFYKVKSIPHFKTDNIITIAAIDNICKLFEANRKDMSSFKYLDIFSKGSFSEYFIWKAKKENLNVTGHIYNIKENNIHDGVFTPFNNEKINVDVYNCDKDSNLKNENIQKFIGTVKEKVDLICSGYMIENGDEDLLQDNIEENYYQILLTQVIITLSTLNNGGNIIIKIYDLYQSFTIELMYILAKHFEKISIVNSISSTINHCKRYIYCQNFKGAEQETIDFLYEVNQEMNETTKDGSIKWHKLMKDEKVVVTHIIENEIDEDFVDDIQSLNMKYLILQNEYYKKLLNMMFEHSKYRIDTSDVIRECQRQWNLQ
ncbi:hypothetical protein LY90DRAFT_664285 [Neocallimastix californiae]|uniref:Cap-specific mRNA (nucleoside-2'-O-)-methyltransferase 1 n=1 Tax=Neocallimastix californiae TaxID=1754190 RepID=A0A1Y2FDY1_9FUNG|nr:hypothetical protein LY90DRAFT_664285 [Neocallimastix californiae]|eukprot:ORY81055.1 hypothetical protein LY90DRAFT_664285 [Neocallimastix californiae]